MISGKERDFSKQKVLANGMNSVIEIRNKEKLWKNRERMQNKPYAVMQIEEFG